VMDVDGDRGMSKDDDLLLVARCHMWHRHFLKCVYPTRSLISTCNTLGRFVQSLVIFGCKSIGNKASISSDQEVAPTCCSCDGIAVELLKKDRVEVNFTDKHGKAALLLAIPAGETAVCSRIVEARLGGCECQR
jgi:hypothetical protein